ncbi:MAG: peroxidase family protein [Ornithinibacter sp.]
MPDLTSRSSENWTFERDEAVRLLDKRDFAAAAEHLTAAAEADETGQSNALLGLAHYLSEDYAAAAVQYRRAVDRDPQRRDWRHMLAASRRNAEAEVNVYVPEVQFFDRDRLLAHPVEPALPEPGSDGSPQSIARRVRYVVGHAVGSVAGVVFDGLVTVVGPHYRGEVWTNWYRKRLYRGILTLAYMREKLDRDNLMSTYPTGSRVAFLPDGLEPPAGVTHYRTADGSWNNLADPKEGAAGTRFPRNVANAAITPEAGDRLLTPNPRAVSRTLLTRGDTMAEVPFLNLLAASWIQFQNHDWINHGENVTNELIEVPLPDDDPAREQFRQSTMFVGRTQPDPTRQPTGEETPVTFINEVTHWWDGSQLYGSDQQTQDRLRSGVDGKLRIADDGRLPTDRKGIEETGMVRNWWVGLAMMHTLFALEHNAICDRLKASHPDWDDPRLFNTARLVNAAVMAKIHSVEWTPAILPNKALNLGLNSNWYGMLTYTFRSPERRRTVAEFNVSNPELGGLVGNHIDKHGQPFGLTEEFVEVYRLHSLLPETLRITTQGQERPVEEVPFVASRQAGSAKLTERVGMADMFHSFGKQHPGALQLNNFPTFLQELSIPGNPVFDMGTVDILRARERGVPRYNEFRRQLGLNPIRSFHDLTDDKEQVARIEQVYGDDVEALDLLVGTLAEGHRPTGFGFGETMFQIFILNASRRLQADRFYTDDYREEVYSPEGMDWVDRTTLKDVILRHYPELANTGLGNVKNAFEPWDTTPELSAERHPLRGFDPDLRKDPWTGDAVRAGRAR